MAGDRLGSIRDLSDSNNVWCLQGGAACHHLISNVRLDWLCCRLVLCNKDKVKASGSPLWVICSPHGPLIHSSAHLTRLVHPSPSPLGLSPFFFSVSTQQWVHLWLYHKEYVRRSLCVKLGEQNSSARWRPQLDLWPLRHRTTGTMMFSHISFTSVNV